MVPRVRLGSLRPHEFEEYLRANQPVLLTEGTADWPATSDWLTSAGEPDLHRLAAMFGESIVSVVNSRGKRGEMALSEYADWWSARGNETNESVVDLLYLKDWHLPALHPSYTAYHLPEHLADDWLNEHWAATRHASSSDAADANWETGDHRFVYIGPAGSKTTLHADVLFSYSWSANICGTKHWWVTRACLHIGPCSYAQLCAQDARARCAERAGECSIDYAAAQGCSCSHARQPRATSPRSGAESR